MRSMTGYGKAHYNDEQYNVTIEIYSVNSRHLDVSVSLPQGLYRFESFIRSLAAANAFRGRIEITVALCKVKENIAMHIDTNAVQVVKQALRQIADIAGVQDTISLQDILSLEGVLSKRQSAYDTKECETIITSTLQTALDNWNVGREAEGLLTQENIELHIQRIKKCIDICKKSTVDSESSMIDFVKERFSALLGDVMEEQRLYTEAAALIIKHSTNEELMRAEMHLKSLKQLIAQQESIGKKADFICQEISREVNTISSKTLDGHVQLQVVEAKDAIESIREQLRNIE